MSEALNSLFIALSDPTRLRLLRLMAGGEVSVGYLADELGESQPKVSRHLATLRTMGLVSTRREGKHIFYAIENQADASADAILSIAIGNTPNVAITNEPTRIPNRIQSEPEEMAVWLL